MLQNCLYNFHIWFTASDDLQTDFLGKFELILLKGTMIIYKTAKLSPLK